MTTTLRLAAQTSTPLEIEGVVPDRVRILTLAEIEKLPIQHGNRKVALAEFFRVSGDPADARIDIEGDCSGVHGIGAGMTEGEIRVHGDAGRHVGSAMTGGQLTVVGNVSDYAGCEMHGGLLVIAGNAGHLAGAAYPGSKKGMTDGTILINGSAGSHAGASMRRGILAIRGACGDGPGFNMIAGSILVFGTCGSRPGAGMKRGTIALLGNTPIRLLPTFRMAGTFRPLFFRLLFRELGKFGFAVDQELDTADLSLAHGDLVALGKGEIWMKAV